MKNECLTEKPFREQADLAPFPSSVQGWRTETKGVPSAARPSGLERISGVFFRRLSGCLGGVIVADRQNKRFHAESAMGRNRNRETESFRIRNERRGGSKKAGVPPTSAFSWRAKVRTEDHMEEARFRSVELETGPSTKKEGKLLSIVWQSGCAVRKSPCALHWNNPQVVVVLLNGRECRLPLVSQGASRNSDIPQNP